MRTLLNFCIAVAVLVEIYGAWQVIRFLSVPAGAGH